MFCESCGDFVLQPPVSFETPRHRGSVEQVSKVSTGTQECATINFIRGRSNSSTRVVSTAAAGPVRRMSRTPSAFLRCKPAPMAKAVSSRLSHRPLRCAGFLRPQMDFRLSSSEDLLVGMPRAPSRIDIFHGFAQRNGVSACSVRQRGCRFLPRLGASSLRSAGRPAMMICSSFPWRFSRIPQKPESLRLPTPGCGLRRQSIRRFCLLLFD